MMNRWYVTTPNGTVKLYADRKEDIKLDGMTNIEPCYDKNYLKYIKIIKSNADFMGCSNNRELYSYSLNGDNIFIKLSKDKDGDYYDYAMYQVRHQSDVIIPIMFTMSTPEDVVKLFFDIPKVQYLVHSKRKYGEPKLSKPKELSKIKQTCSIQYNHKCSFPVYIKENDVWIKSKDYFSPVFMPKDTKDIGTPLNYRLKKYFNTDKSYLDKFIYSDSWGEIVLRAEAWLCFTNIMPSIRQNWYNASKIMYNTMKKNDVNMRDKTIDDSCFREWKWFYESLCVKLNDKEGF